MWNGKRTARMELPRQLRADEELAKVIRERASINRRSIGQELLYLLDAGIKSESVGFGQKESERSGL